MRAFPMWCLVFFGALAQAGEPRLEVTEKFHARTGLKEMTTEAVFHHARVIYKTWTEPGKTEVVINKWVDYVFGLEPGRGSGAGRNDGWSVWRFLGIFYAKDGGRPANALTGFQAGPATLTRFDECAMVDFVFPLDAEGEAGTVAVKLAEFPSHPDWLFCRATFDGGTKKPRRIERIDLSAYSGNSRQPPERERWAAMADREFNLGREPASFAPAGPGLMLFNKFLQEDAGVLLVYEPDAYAKLTIPKTSAGVNIQLTPKPDRKVFHFALGTFREQAPADVRPRFFDETADLVASFMSGINWAPPLPADALGRSAAEVEQLLADLAADGVETAIFAEEWAALRERYAAAAKDGDAAAAFAALADADNLRHRAAAAGLAAWRQ